LVGRSLRERPSLGNLRTHAFETASAAEARAEQRALPFVALGDIPLSSFQDESIDHDPDRWLSEATASDTTGMHPNKSSHPEGMPTAPHPVTNSLPPPTVPMDKRLVSV